jgi:Peptidase family M1 domain/Peptidase M1 N-terminal domain/Immune inhibitor A peptidase M6
VLAGRRSTFSTLLLACVAVVLALGPTASGQNGGGEFVPGAAGAGDPYFPLDGNGGYDVRHYDLEVKYDPAADLLGGKAKLRATATQNLSSFNLDLVGLTVHSVVVNGRRAFWSREGGELTIAPERGLPERRNFTVVVRYSGVPESLEGAGFLHTDDGALVVGQPHVAASWYPVNDHPTDKASYSFQITVPAGLEAVANGVLTRQRTRHEWTTWSWEATEPMASYLTTATMGEFDLRGYRADGLRFWDAVDPDLYVPITPRTGTQFAVSQQSEPSYKRLQRTISVPAGGATLSFWVTRDTELDWDFLFVEAHEVGTAGWTTLPDQNGHTSRDTGFSCPGWHALHPFLEHYQTANDDATCDPSGTTGEWNAISGASDGWEHWSVDLGAYAGSTVKVSITYASDDVFQAPGVFVDDVVVSTGAGSTSFEDDGNTMDGWTVSGAPAGSLPNAKDWIAGTAADAPPPLGVQIDETFSLQPEIVEFLENRFGDYPFSAGGALVDDVAALGFALENQTRPIYAIEWFFDPLEAEGVFVHEIAHQWYGDSLALALWQHIWLNEGFATYAEWLWFEEKHGVSAQATFDGYYFGIPEDDPFWQVVVGDPSPDLLFDDAVYFRGAMTLHELRLAVGDRVFFKILKRWAQKREGDNVTTDELIALAEKASGEELDELFETWLFTPGRPELSEPLGAEAARTSASAVAGATRLRPHGRLRR